MMITCLLLNILSVLQLSAAVSPLANPCRQVYSYMYDCCCKNLDVIWGVPADNVTSIKSLHLQYNILDNLDQDFLTAFINLEELLLHNNAFTSLGPGLFDSLKGLRWLRLNYNKMENIHSNVFTALIKLIELRLDYNELENIHSNVFTALIKLIELLLNNNKLTTLNQGLFDSLISLKTLRLDSNLLESLDRDIFTALINLDKLSLNDNRLTVIEPSLFASLSNLKSLILQNNNITSLVPEHFETLQSLHWLHIGYLHLTMLEPRLFDGLTNLYILNLENNQLKWLDPGMLDTLENLITLHLEENKIKLLDIGLFDAVPRLKSLYLSNNELTTLDIGLFDATTSIELLELSHNKLSTLDTQLFATLGRLYELNLGFNHLESLTGTFDIDLQNNQLSALCDGIFDSFVDLGYLYLNGNKIQYLGPMAFKGLENLNTLHFSPVCSCSYGRKLLSINSSVTIIFISNGSDVTELWTELLQNCSSEWINSTHCNQSEMYSLYINSTDGFCPSHTEIRTSTDEPVPSTEGIAYAVMAGVAGVFASVLAYFTFSSWIHDTLTSFRDGKVTEQQCADTLTQLFDSNIEQCIAGRLKTVCINIPPLSHKEALLPIVLHDRKIRQK